MAEYIDRYKLLRDIEHYHVSDGKMQHLVEIQPTVDAVPVVRCKDCVFWDKLDCYMIESTRPDDFCSYGERKDDHHVDDR